MGNENVVARVSLSMQELAKQIDAELEKIAAKRIGFSLVVYTYPRASYISNCSREDGIAQLEELLNHWKSEMPDIPAHKFS